MDWLIKAVVFLIVCGVMASCVPACTYSVQHFRRWNTKMELNTLELTQETSIKEFEIEGKKKLAEAEWARKVQVADAVSKQEAAKSLAQVEVERAKGVAEANRIIGDSLKNNESYLRYLWVTNLEKAGAIYIPTEAGMPILEAGHKPSKVKKQEIEINETTKTD